MKIPRRACSFRWSKALGELVGVGVLIAAPAVGRATGYYGPSIYLDEGGRRVTESPEFFWELEVKRLARDFHPPEKWLPRPALAQSSDSNDAEETVLGQRLHVLSDFTGKADDADFAAALQAGAIKPPDPAAAAKQNRAARAALDPVEETLPAEFDSEFADYHQGAFAFRKGPEHYAEARAAWEKLLARPASERQYRSVWAAFMIGKLLLKSGDPKAPEWFAKSRQLAHDGFADALGLAADSYGWEGRSEWKQGHPEKAAPLFLTQLALGDESAVISLKALIPDREPVDGWVNYGPESDELAKTDPAALHAREEKERAELQNDARDPLLRRLITLHILAAGQDPFFEENTGRPAVKRSTRWLGIIEAAKIKQTADAEYLGWLAYDDGKYDAAARWLALSGGDSPAALWLKAELLRRSGKLDAAVAAMAKAVEQVRDSASYTGWKATAPAAAEDDGNGWPDDRGLHWDFTTEAAGDLGGLRLAHAEFVGALDSFLKGALWLDAAFVAERILTVDELKTYVDQQPAGPAENPPKTDDLRYLLGRRLVREDRYAEAMPYLPPLYQKVLDLYAKALASGANAALPKEERARGWFTAAWIARQDGMEIMGTEGAPDVFAEAGEYEESDLGEERLAGTHQNLSYDAKGPARLPNPLPASAAEKHRLAQKNIQPDVRYHYRIIAGALAQRAAELLPDHSEEVADVLNKAGQWVLRDEKLADRYYQILERRGAGTKIGQAAAAKHWFVDAGGPWSQEQAAAHDALVPPAGDPED